jgi:hypothetical protein
MKLTADTITDEQIRELRDSVLVHMCEDALGNFHAGRLSADQIGARVDHARARCAALINARAKEDV